MSKKYYAVAKGRTPGIYLSWEECKAQVDQFSGAMYKGFSTREEAEGFIENAGVSVSKNDVEQMTLDIVESEGQEELVSTDTRLIAYVDGSFNKKIQQYAYACVFVLPDGVKHISGSGDEPNYVERHNVAGEILSSENAVLWALEHGYQEIIIYYDYNGIEGWANGWQTNNPETQRYKEFIAEKRKQITISFQYVEAHSGVKYNEMVDKLAKREVGLYDGPIEGLVE